MHLILASASPRRKELLSQLLSDYEILAADIPEDLNSELPSLSAQIEELSLRKALAIAKDRVQTCFVLGADTVVVVSGEILGKPANFADAQRMLKKLSGQWHEVLTGVALVKTGPNELRLSDHALSRVKMRMLTDSEISDYIASGEPMDKAGAYAIQGHAKAFIEEVQGHWDTIVGLPLETVAQLLKTADYPL
jgi:septum formation protein